MIYQPVCKRLSYRLKTTPIVAFQNDNGKIKLVEHKSTNLILPTAADILSADLAGSTCVLTRTNDEALQFTSLLLKNGMEAKLIQSNEGFGIQNL